MRMVVQLSAGLGWGLSRQSVLVAMCPNTTNPKAATIFLANTVDLTYYGARPRDLSPQALKL